MKALVLDCSVIVTFIRPEQSQAYSHKTYTAIQEETQCYVPPIFFSELTNVIFQHERKKFWENADSIRLYNVLELLRLETYAFPSNAEDIEPLLEACRTYGLTAYDASYLKVAQTLKIPLATLDKALAKAAKKLNCYFE